MLRDLLRFSKDPTIHCELYKQERCYHVDGYLCNVDNCLLLKEWKEKNGKNNNN